MHNQTRPSRAESVSLRHENFVNRNSQRQVHYHTLARFVQVLPPWVQAQNWTALKVQRAAALFQQQNKN